MTQETPGKVLTLLCTALVSMFALFVVTATNASFSGAETAFPDPFSPTNVMAVLNKDPFGPQVVMAMLSKDPFGPENVLAMLDKPAYAYSAFLHENLSAPAEAQMAFYRDSGRWVIDQASDPILAMTGLSDLASVQYYQNLDQAHYAATQAPRVAGAFTERGDQTGGFGINSLYSLLIR